MHFNADVFVQVKLWDSIQYFLTRTLPDLGWSSGDSEVVMDVGCGQGLRTKNHVLPCFPNVEKLIAIDATPGMIEKAELLYPHPKIEYVLANIEDRITIEKWMGQISKLISIHCFNWVKDQRKGFQIVYDLLRPGGEAAFIFALQCSYYDGVLDVGKDPKWSSYFENADFCIPQSYLKNWDSSIYKRILEDIGFKIIHCKDEWKEDVLSHQAYKDMFHSVCPLTQHVPKDLREEFTNDLLQSIQKYDGKSPDGLPIHWCKVIEIFIRKEK